MPNIATMKASATGNFSLDSSCTLARRRLLFRARQSAPEHVPPDPSAAKLWLTNRRPEEWREKTYNELSGKDGAPLVLSSMLRSVELNLALSAWPFGS